MTQLQWPLRHLKRSETVARTLVRRITGAGMRDGDRLDPEPVMMEQLGTGRGTLREAFRILEVSGVLEVRTGPTGGPVVRTPDVGHFASMSSLYLHMQGATYRDIMHTLLAIEPAVANAGALSRTEEQLDALRKAVEFESSVDSPDGRARMRGQALFHDAVASLANNPVLELYLRGLHFIFAERLGSPTFSEQTRAENLESHRHVVRAIEAKDGSAAALALSQQLDRNFQHLGEEFGPVLDEVVAWI